MIVLTLLCISVCAWLLTKKYGFESLLVFSAPIHRIFLDFGFALKAYYIIVLLSVFAAIAKKRNPDFSFKADSLFKLIWVFIVSILVVTLMNGADVISFRHIVVFVLVITGSYLVYRKITGIDDMRRIVRIYLSVGLWLGLSGLAFYGLYFIRPDLCVEGSIFNGVIYDLARSWTWPSLQSVDVGPNGYAMTLLPFLFVSLGVFLSANKIKEKIYSGFVFLLLFLNLFLTFSRGGMVAFFLVALLIIFLSGRRKVLKVVYFFLLAISFPFLFQYASDSYITYSTMKGAYSGEGSDLMSSRGELFMSSVEVFLAHPVFGVGQGVISDPKYVGKQSHNTYIELLAENGVFPFILFAMVLVSLSRKMLYIQRQVRINKQYFFCMPFVFGMLALLIAAIPTSAITMTLLWVHMAIILAFYNVLKNASVYSAQKEEIPAA